MDDRRTAEENDLEYPRVTRAGGHEVTIMTLRSRTTVLQSRFLSDEFSLHRTTQVPTGAQPVRLRYDNRPNQRTYRWIHFLIRASVGWTVPVFCYLQLPLGHGNLTQRLWTGFHLMWLSAVEEINTSLRPVLIAGNVECDELNFSDDN
ncbi:hypothetical protein F2P81_009643 [Scophthalmus maximus]|uniref:Uncharacterized protein n=1 Tax=Scophthalmus maximus TaxID=52904 RepID=A0A6A4T2I9_SCOMX|nr:hypothetical protein F2P81_009643 [Scophthalmus maximus]